MSDYLNDRLALQDVMLRYAAAVDDRDYEAYRALFTDDVEVVGMGSETITGLDNWYEWWREALSRYGNTQHMLGPILVNIDGDRAETRSDVQAWHALKDQPEKTVTLWATYKTNMVRVDNGWKIDRHELVVRGSRAE